MAFTKVAPAGIGSTPGEGYRIGDSFLHSTGVDITNINATGIVTATGIELTGSIGQDIARLKIPDGMNGAPFTGNLEFGNNRDFVVLHDGHHNYIKSNNGNIYVTAGGNVLTTLQTNGTVLLNKDLDVDGHTELDNVRISGIASVHNTLQFTNTGGGHIDHGAVNHNLNFRVSKSSTADTNMMQINAASEQTKFRKVVTVGLQGGGDTTVIGGGSGIGAYLQLNYANRLR